MDLWGQPDGGKHGLQLSQSVFVKVTVLATAHGPIEFAGKNRQGSDSDSSIGDRPKYNFMVRVEVGAYLALAPDVKCLCILALVGEMGC